MDPSEVAREAKQFFAIADIDKNGCIDFTEWSVATVNKRALLNEQNLRTAFDLFDKDGSGKISAEEIAQILGRDNKKDPGVWQRIVDEVDCNGDGHIDFTEFKTMMDHLIKDKKKITDRKK